MDIAEEKKRLLEEKKSLQQENYNLRVQIAEMESDIVRLESHIANLEKTIKKVKSAGRATINSNDLTPVEDMLMFVLGPFLHANQTEFDDDRYPYLRDICHRLPEILVAKMRRIEVSEWVSVPKLRKEVLESISIGNDQTLLEVLLRSFIAGSHYFFSGHSMPICTFMCEFLENAQLRDEYLRILNQTHEEVLNLSDTPRFKQRYDIELEDHAGDRMIVAFIYYMALQAGIALPALSKGLYWEENGLYGDLECATDLETTKRIYRQIAESDFAYQMECIPSMLRPSWREQDTNDENFDYIIGN